MDGLKIASYPNLAVNRSEGLQIFRDRGPRGDRLTHGPYEEPYDLGSFDDIVHSRGGRDGRAVTFDGALQDDFENKRLIANPLGTLYSTQGSNNFMPTHKRLLRRTNLCRT